MRLNSIRARMTLAFSLCIGILMLLAFQLLTWDARDAAEHNAHTLLEATARKVADDLTDDERRVPLSALPMEEREILRPESIALLVINGSNRVEERTPGRTPSWPHPNHDLWRFEGFPFETHRVLLALPWDKTEQALHRQAASLFVLGLFVTLVASAGAWLLVGRTLYPIGALARQAQTASVEDLHLRLNAPSADVEIVNLVSTLNGLLTRVADTVAAKGRFHAAASHELRTPLQAMSGHLELALNRERTNAEYRRFLVEANTYSQRLIDLTRDILLLHQLDAARSTLQMDVDLSDVCARTLALLGCPAEERGLKMQMGLAENVTIAAAPTHAEMLIRNLLENAVKYATPGGLVKITLESELGPAQLEIYNECPPLSPTDLEKLFEPFYRPDAARASDTGGSGLGLAICKALASANGWHLSLRQVKGGITATVLFGTGCNMTGPTLS
jgi:signal transduction histidine kinase